MSWQEALAAGQEKKAAGNWMTQVRAANALQKEMNRRTGRAPPTAEQQSANLNAILANRRNRQAAAAATRASAGPGIAGIISDFYAQQAAAAGAGGAASAAGAGGGAAFPAIKAPTELSASAKRNLKGMPWFGAPTPPGGQGGGRRKMRKTRKLNKKRRGLTRTKRSRRA